MTKEQVVAIREKYKGQPILFICDNEHNFFDNYPDRCLPVWDDGAELVTFVESNMENSGMDSNIYPYITAVTSYDYIQSARVFTDKGHVSEFLALTKDKNGVDAYKYAKEIISMMCQNSKPTRNAYYK